MYYIKRKPKTKEDGSIDWSAYNKPRKPLKPVSDKKRKEVEQSTAREKKTSQKAKKPRQKSRATLIRELDAVFSKYIRMRDSKDFGFKYCRCISCGQIKPFDHFDAGHYYSRTKYSVRWDESNVNAECSFCNRFCADHLIGYRANLIEKIGQRNFDILQFRANQTSKISNFELEQMIKLYKAKTEQLIEDSKPKSGLVKKKIGE